ncbi:MAG: metallophosphoesterase family protein [Pirellulales bacterium]|nr:metallophosphoesterase family protein [Pirellulales bacterium]
MRRRAARGGTMPDIAYAGLLLIGDPHLEGRVPGFRMDEYPTVILEKLKWCLDYARRESLLPAMLGDLFDKPRDNPNWLVARLLDILPPNLLGIYGNHDCKDPELNEHDTLSILIKAGRYRLLDAQQPWRGEINGREVILGGSSYRQPLPTGYPPVTDQSGAHRKQTLSPDNGTPAAPSRGRNRKVPATVATEPLFKEACSSRPLVIWLTHHDLTLPGYDDGRHNLCELPGIDLVVNGHIHRKFAEVACGGTVWCNPGNISRRARNDATRLHIPAALRVDVTVEGLRRRWIDIPHAGFDDVFYPAIVETEATGGPSGFVAGLAELQARRTASGAGLHEFLRLNMGNFEPDIAQEIWTLAQETTT